MDRKSVIILVISLALLFSWPAIVGRIFPPTQVSPHQTNRLDSVTDQLAPKSSTTAPAPTNSASMATAPRPAPAPPAEPEQTLTLEDDNARYTLTSHGGGIKSVELKRYPATIDCRSKKNTNSNGLATLNQRAHSPALSFSGGSELEGDGLFALTEIPGGARAEKVLPSGLRVLKEF